MDSYSFGGCCTFLIWINSWILYAFGEMVENISIIKDIAKEQSNIGEIELMSHENIKNNTEVR